MQIVRTGLLLWALGAVSGSGAEGVELYPLEDVRPGQHAQAVTVLHGFEADTLDLEILDVYATSTPGSQIVLARGLGELERTGIAQGMSGSPVFIEGRLLGALAFAFTETREAIGGITPFVEMRSALDPYFDEAPREDAHSEPPQLAPRSSKMPPFPEWQRLCATGEWAALLAGNTRSASLPDYAPIGLPLLWSGPPAIGESLAPLFEASGLNLVPMAAAPASGTASGPISDEEWPRSLRPGDAIALNLLWGDASAAAIGTVTWADGDRIYALGHPFLQTGVLSVPVSRARIHTVVPSRRVSFKIGTSGPQVGAVIADKRPGVSARMGAQAEQIPLTLVLKDADRSDPDEPRDRTFQFHVAQHEFLTPTLLNMAVGATLVSEEYALGVSTLESHLRLTLPDGRTIERRDLFRTLSPAQTVGADILAPVSFLTANTFSPFALSDIHVEIRLDDELRAAEIDRIRIPQETFEPGGRLPVEIHLRRHLGGEETRRVEVTLPDDLRSQQVTVMVGSAYAFFEWDRDQAPERYRPRDFDHLVQLIEEFPANDQLIVRVYGPSRGLLLRGQEISSMPLSKWSALSSGTTGGEVQPVARRLLTEVVLDTDDVILGGLAVQAVVEQ